MVEEAADLPGDGPELQTAATFGSVESSLHHRHVEEGAIWESRAKRA